MELIFWKNAPCFPLAVVPGALAPVGEVWPLGGVGLLDPGGLWGGWGAVRSTGVAQSFGLVLLSAQSPCYLLTHQNFRTLLVSPPDLSEKSVLNLKENRTASPWLLLFAILVSDNL